MELINSIQLDMVKKGNAPVIYAVQNEFYTRIVSANLFANGFPFDATGCVVSVAYKKPDGTSGWYDTLPDGTVAYTSDGNNVSVSIAPQMLSVAGIVNATIRIETADGLHRAVTFPFYLNVAEDPATDGSKSENYYSVQNWDDVNEKISQIEADIDRLESQGGGGGGNGKLEGNLVLNKGEGVDSIVQVITTESGAPELDNKPTATGEAAISLGAFCNVSGHNSAAVNYNNRVSADRAFAANWNNDVAGYGCAGFGADNTITETAKHSATFGATNIMQAINALLSGNQNEASAAAMNSLMAGLLNICKAANGLTVGENNTMGCRNGFVGGNRCTIEDGTRNSIALGEKLILAANDAANFGCSNEVRAVYAFCAGLQNLISASATGAFVAGRNLIPKKAWQTLFGQFNKENTSALFIVGNGTSDTARSNAFEVKNNSIVVGGQELTADDIADLQGLREDLEEQIDNIDITNHNHDSQYYTQSQVDSKIAAITQSSIGAAKSSHTHSNYCVKLGTGTTYLPPTWEDLLTLNDMVTGSLDEDERFDANGDGYLSIVDFEQLYKAWKGEIPVSSFANAQKSTVTATFNPNDPDKLVHMTGTNMWGSTVELAFGISTITEMNSLKKSIETLESTVDVLKTRIEALENGTAS